jgi:tripartite-type tricarboxylate transporter receptor subunit TctC
MGRPFFMSAGTSAERAAVMRAAFDATMKDPAFLEEAVRSKLEIGPVSGDGLARIVGKMFEASPDVLAAAKLAME